MCFHQSSLSRYHWIVCAIPVSKLYFGFHPSSVSILVGSIAYLLSWPGRSFTYLIRDSGLSRAFQDGLYYLKVCSLVVSANVVNLAYFTFMDNQVDCFTMVGYVQPVSDILTVSVYRKLFVCQCAADHKRNQLFREVIRAVVVGASGNGNRGTEGSVVSQYKQVCACLGCRVRAGGVDRGILCKEQVRAIQRKVSVNFIGRYLMISLYAEFSGSIQQYTGSHYVGTEQRCQDPRWNGLHGSLLRS